MELTHKIRDSVDLVIDAFDFHKIHEVMKYLNWGWGAGEDYHIPDTYDLIRESRRMIFRAIDDLDEGSEYYISCGGFHVEVKHYTEDDYVNVNLSFRLEDCSSYDLEG